VGNVCGVGSIEHVAGGGVRLEEWGAGDLPLLRRTLGDPEMTRYIGGPESEEKLVDRQARFEKLAASGTGHMFKIVDETTDEAIGTVGYWDRPDVDEDVYEAGWFVVPGFQGRGVATAATRLAVARARAEGKHRYLHAYPSVENGPSNALCATLGFTLLGATDFEYPPGNTLRCNDWRLDLTAPGATP
jgi:RimJ/RimL family protein N-acetyltransferase